MPAAISFKMFKAPRLKPGGRKDLTSEVITPFKLRRNNYC